MKKKIITPQTTRCSVKHNIYFIRQATYLLLVATLYSLKFSVDRLLTAFSLKRNWYRLTSETKPEHRDLSKIFRFKKIRKLKIHFAGSMNAIKTIVMFLITNGHVLWFVLSMPMKNPIFVEQNYHNLPAMIMINGENLPNTFFVFSGFLLCVLSYPMLQDERHNTKKFFIKAVIYRYVRLMPLMTLFLMLDSTWLYRLGSGPFWDRINFSERQFCRKNWWTNLFFLNNYISDDEKV